MNFDAHPVRPHARRAEPSTGQTTILQRGSKCGPRRGGGGVPRLKSFPRASINE